MAGDIVLPSGFLWGTATAAHQVEGGNVNDWTAWEQQPGRIADGTVSGIACDHYNRYREDIAEMAAQGHTSYRFSVEWSRIEPSEGVFNQAALAHYADVVATCRLHGIEPLVTLQHFTLPQWLAAKGGVLAHDGPELFERYSTKVAERLGGQVKWWTTVNEPNVLATLAYMGGVFPPGERSIIKALQASAALVRWHCAGARALRKVAADNRWDIKVSIAHHERPIKPATDSFADKVVAGILDYVFNRSILQGCQDGRIGLPLGFGESIPGGGLDYIGVNYYCDQNVSFTATSPGTMFARTVSQVCSPDGIVPAPISGALQALYKDFGLPILITENGTNTLDDRSRQNFLIETVAGVADAIAHGVKVFGYTHWSTMRNFEWSNGWVPDFGIWDVNRDPLSPLYMERTAKPSAATFSAIIRANGIPGSLRRGLPVAPGVCGPPVDRTHRGLATKRPPRVEFALN